MCMLWLIGNTWCGRSWRRKSSSKCYHAGAPVHRWQLWFSFCFSRAKQKLSLQVEKPRSGYSTLRAQLKNINISNGKAKCNGGRVEIGIIRTNEGQHYQESWEPASTCHQGSGFSPPTTRVTLVSHLLHEWGSSHICELPTLDDWTAYSSKS